MKKNSQYIVPSWSGLVLSTVERRWTLKAVSGRRWEESSQVWRDNSLYYQLTAISSLSTVRVDAGVAGA